MNTAAIRDALETIDRHQKALAWFEKYGDDMMSARVTVDIHTNVGTMETGYFPAMEAITEMLTDEIGPQITQVIDQCKFEISVAKALIEKELE